MLERGIQDLTVFYFRKTIRRNLDTHDKRPLKRTDMLEHIICVIFFSVPHLNRSEIIPAYIHPGDSMVDWLTAYLLTQSCTGFMIQVQVPTSLLAHPAYLARPKWVRIHLRCSMYAPHQIVDRLTHEYTVS